MCEMTAAEVTVQGLMELLNGTNEVSKSPEQEAQIQQLKLSLLLGMSEGKAEVSTDILGAIVTNIAKLRLNNP